MRFIPSESPRQREVVFLGNRIEFLIVAADTSDGYGEKIAWSCIDLLTKEVREA